MASIAFFDGNTPQPLAALIATLVARERSAAACSRIGQRMAAFGKTPDLYRA